MEYPMQTVTAKLTDRLSQELDRLIAEGWYANRSEAMRDAVREMVERRDMTELERAVREDIDWALHG